TACTFSSELNLVIKKLHLQLVVVSNNWGAVHSGWFFVSRVTRTQLAKAIIKKDRGINSLDLS
ncbi:MULTISPECIES: hypothetical protein, partial [unclassified Paenibacillus]|uniref:hypothetical protein n=1 Tax=unclassified Paenibacillus TaxID=185978 RepID=UPI001C4DEBB6